MLTCSVASRSSGWSLLCWSFMRSSSVRVGVFSDFEEPGRLLCEEGREDAWQGAEANSRLPDQVIESLRDVRSERREGAGVGVGLLRLRGDNRR